MSSCRLSWDLPGVRKLDPSLHLAGGHTFGCMYFPEKWIIKCVASFSCASVVWDTGCKAPSAEWVCLLQGGHRCRPAPGTMFSGSPEGEAIWRASPARTGQKEERPLPHLCDAGPPCLGFRFLLAPQRNKGKSRRRDGRGAHAYMTQGWWEVERL